jgi:hypothetical protein
VACAFAWMLLMCDWLRRRGLDTHGTARGDVVIAQHAAPSGRIGFDSLHEPACVESGPQPLS